MTPMFSGCTPVLPGAPTGAVMNGVTPAKAVIKGIVICLILVHFGKR